jgi:hypothetical protein
LRDLRLIAVVVAGRSPFFHGDFSFGGCESFGSPSVTVAVSSCLLRRGDGESPDGAAVSVSDVGARKCLRLKCINP